MKTHEDKKGFQPSSEEVTKLREELRTEMSNKEIEESWRLEALDRVIALLQMDPAEFHRSWIEPLLAAGASLEVAYACIAESYFQPN